MAQRANGRGEGAGSWQIFNASAKLSLEFLFYFGVFYLI